MKKFLLFLACVLLVFGPATLHVYADETVKICAEDISVDPGGTFTLHVKLEDNQGLAAWMVDLSWNPEVMEIQEKSVENGDSFSKGIMLDNSEEEGQLKVTWFSANNVYDDGDLFTVDFKLKESVVSGEYEILVFCPDGNTITEEEEVISPMISNATVKVNSKETPKEKGTDKESEKKSDEPASKEEIVGEVDESKNEGLTLNYNTLTIANGAETTLSVAEDEDSLIWTSSDESVVKVKDGKIIPVSPGKAEISVESVDEHNKSTCTVIVKENKEFKSKFEFSKKLFLWFTISIVVISVIFVLIKSRGHKDQNEK